MRFEEEWSANEDRLVQEAGSLGQLLGRLRGIFSPQLIGDPQWQQLTACAQGLPPTLAGFPLWIGFPVDDSQPVVYLDVSLPGGTRAAASVREKGRVSAADPLTRIAASLLEETAREDSPVRRVAGDRVLLHHDMDPVRRVAVESRAALYPVRATLPGGNPGAGLQGFRQVLDTLGAVAGRVPDAAERGQLERVYLAMELGTRIGAISVSPCKERALCLTVLGLSGAEHSLAFLERAGWCGESAALARVLARLGAEDALADMHLGVQFDVTAAGVGQALELQVFSANTIYDDTGWFKDKGCWNRLIDGLRKADLADPEKLSELDAWAFAAKPLFGRSGPLLLLQRIHHFAILLEAGSTPKVNAHVFLLLTRWGRNTTTSG